MRTLISNVSIIDGTGNPIVQGSVLFDSQGIIAVDKQIAPSSADELIDGNGCYLAPGFIDLHSHSDLAALSPQILAPKLAQGITTEVCGVCGLGVAPVSKQWSENFRQQSIIGQGAFAWPWESFADYRSCLAQKDLDQNLIPFVGHGVLRYAVAQNRGGSLSDLELEQMKSLLQQSFEEGAKGLSLGLIYLPALYADARELRAVISVAAKFQKIVMVHLRSESDAILEAISEVADICQQEGASLHLSHLKIIGQSNGHLIEPLFELLEKYQLSFDHYPYCFGSTSLFSLLPPWLLKGDDPKEMIDHLRDQQALLRAIYSGHHSTENYRQWGWDNLPKLVGWDNIIITSLQHDRHGPEIGLSLRQLATLWKMDETAALLQLLANESGQVMMIDTYMDESLLNRIMTHPRGMFSTDSLFVKNPHPRVSGAFAKILGEYVFKQKWLTLEEAIAKMTGRSAKRLGLTDRGFIKKGMRSDLVLFSSEIGEQEGLPPLGVRAVWRQGVLLSH